MKVMLIKPKIGERENAPYIPVSRMEPIAIGVLAALTPPDIELSFFDDRIEEVPFGAKTDLVAISVDTFSARRAYSIARRFRERGTPVVMGGIHPTILPEEALGHCDAVAVGAAESTWPAMIEDFRGGKLGGRYTGEEACSFATPDRKIFAGKGYLPISLVRYGQGCPNRCEFCSVRVFFGGKVTHRPLGETFREISNLRRRMVFIIDDNLLASRDRTAALLERMIPLRKRWFCQIGAEFTLDDELCRLMARSGCAGVTIGFESLDRGNLVDIDKGPSADLDYEEVVRKARERGMAVYGTFIHGLDRDRPDSFGGTLDFAIRNRLFMANFNHLMPYPGTPLHSRLAREGRLLYDRWWTDPGYRYGHAAFRPMLMTPDELTRGCYENRLEFNRFRNILKRGMDLRANARSIGSTFFYIRSNLVSRREILRKQDLRLGAPEGGVA